MWYVPTSIVSFTTNIKLVWFLLCYFKYFQLSLKVSHPVSKVSHPVALTVMKKELFIVLPYIGNLSPDLRTRLQNKIKKNLPCCKVKVIFQSTRRISNFFCFKDKVPFSLHSNVVYKFSCGRCNATYYGKTCQNLNVRVGEHSGISPLTGKKSKSKTATSAKDHMLFCDHVASLEDVKILTSSNSGFYLKVKESFLRPLENPELNRNEKSLPLYLCD